MIRAGRVHADGELAEIGQQVDPETVLIEVDGIPLPIRPDLEYHLLYKPRGVVSTADDPQGRRIVVDLVDTETRVVPVGRLDVDSEGLLVLTNDGDLTHRLTHPSFGVTKTYVALVKGTVIPGDVARLASGVELEDGPAAALSARILDQARGMTQIEIVMGEGRNREVRRMLDAIGYDVDRLVRIAVGTLRDRTLKSGESRRLSLDEVRELYAAAGVRN